MDSSSSIQPLEGVTRDLASAQKVLLLSLGASFAATLITLLTDLGFEPGSQSVAGVDLPAVLAIPAFILTAAGFGIAAKLSLRKARTILIRHTLTSLSEEHKTMLEYGFANLSPIPFIPPIFLAIGFAKEYWKDIG